MNQKTRYYKVDKKIKNNLRVPNFNQSSLIAYQLGHELGNQEMVSRS